MKLTDKSEKRIRPVSLNRERFGKDFPPRSIAIVGVSRKDNSINVGYTGLRLLRSLKKAEFEGRVYPINPYAGEIEGYKVYARVTDLPERPEMVTITVPAEVVPQVLEDCAAAGAKNVQICTSGFSETGQEQGRMLDAAVREIAEREGLNIVGPNCMGFHVPSVKMRMFEDVPIHRGPVAFLSQSGGHARIFLIAGPEMGIGFSTVISYGNALLMDANDFL
ncbi:MAG: CoA-binding protein, partial [Dehalococcoidia bacterium]|nr:CoA-binding protein [Dehalococcoidia bacterium]